MDSDSKNTIPYTLNHSNASVKFYCHLNEHFGSAIWTNEHDKVKYTQVKHHTLSLYLEGGYSTRRLDQRSAGTGAPNKLCILPAGHHSDWEIGEQQRFVHLYFSDSALKRIALEDFDIDPRRVELPDATYFQDTKLLKNYHRLMSQDWGSPEQQLALQEKMWEILGDVLIRYAIKPSVKTQYQGGLSRNIINRLNEYIAANISNKITLDQLANIAQMSPYHFSRMFKVSTGQTPHQQLMNMRIKKASALLLNRYSQIETSIACGFSSQSHFSRAFRNHYGVTPRQFLRAKGL
ncbi:MAG: helix-turn-helix transcriptional regulator [Cellvibrionaceae bacterium]